MSATVLTLPLDLSLIVALHAQYVDGGRYERDDRHCVLTTTTGSLPFGCSDLTNGGARKPFPFARAELHWSPLGVNGRKIADYTPPDATKFRDVFNYTLTNEADGPGTLDIWGVSATGARKLHMRFGAWVDRNGTAKDHPLVIVQNSDFDWVKLAEADASRAVPAEWAMVLLPKSQIAPRLCPLPKGRPILPVPTIDRKKLTRIAVVPGLSNDAPSNYRPVRTKRGIIVTDHVQAYFISQDMTVKWPRLPMVDGPRGKATGYMFTFLDAGRGWKCLWCDPFALGIFDEEGTKITIAGLRSKDQDFPRYWQDATRDDYELVGVWPQDVPLDERVIRECWAWRFLPSSLALDDNAPLVGGEKPHVGIGPVSFAVGSDGWVWKIQQNGGGPAAMDVFGSKDRASPAILTRWCKTAGGWGLAVVGDEIIVTEREGHEISAWSTVTPNTKLRTILKNPNGANFGAIVGRGWRATQTLDACRAQPVLAPEGLVWFAPPPGRPLSEGWLRFGSIAQQDVRQIRLDGTGLQIVCRPNFTGNSSFLQLDVSQYMPDGTGEFGPPGTTFTTTWEINHLGRPQCFLPQAGVAQDGTPLTNGDWGLVTGSPYPRDRAEVGLSTNNYDVPEGAGGSWESDGYGAAVGVGPGRLLVGTSSIGLHEYVATLPGEVPPDGLRMEKSAQQMRARHLNLIYGHDFHGFFAKGQDLPWDDPDPNIVYRLNALGFTKDPVVVADPPPVITPPPVATPPVVVPPASTGSSMFKSLTKTASTGYPPLAVTGQRVVLALHGSSGGWDTTNTDPNSPRFFKGDEYTAFDQDDIRTELTVLSGGAYGSTTKPPKVIPYIVIAPIDRTIMGLGRPAESWHSGFRRGPDGVFVPHSERMNRTWLDTLRPMLPQADWTKGIVIADSNSMGAGAAVMWGIRQPEVCAVYASQPQWKRLDAWVWELNARATGALPPDLKLDDGTLFADRYNVIPYLADPANSMPGTLQWCKATADTFSAFSDDKAAVATLRARNRNPATLNSQRVHICVHWVPGGHGAPGIYITPTKAPVDGDWQDWRGYELGKGNPVFDNYSLDDDINTAASGWINRGLRFRNVVESADGWSCEVTSTLGPCTVDVWPRSTVFNAPVTAPQRVTIPAALTYVPVSFSAGVVTPPPPAPTIDSFTASATNVTQGSSVTLAWATSNANTVKLSGTLGTVPPTTSTVVTPPLGDTTYTLTATGPGGTVTSTVMVSVRALTDSERITRLEAAALAHGWSL